MNKLFEAGVMRFIAGVDPVRIRLLPPAEGLRMEDIDHAAKIIEDTLVKNFEGSF